MLTFWIIPYVWCTHINTHFWFYRVSTTILLWIQTLCWWNNHFKFLIPWQYSRILHVNTKIHADMINYYCFCCHYFTACALQVICLIFLFDLTSSVTSSEDQVFFLLNKILVRFDSFHIFDALTFIFNHSHLFSSCSVPRITTIILPWGHTICC